MKNTVKSNHLIFLTLSAGLLGLLLRITLYATGLDSKGLLVQGHWARSALLGLTLLLCLLLAAGCALLRCAGKPAGRLQALIGGFGCFLCAGGFLLTALTERTQAAEYPDMLALSLNFVAAAALVFIGIHRCIGRRPHYLAHTLICLAFAVRMITQYRLWSADPQLSDYCFYMISLVALMLTCYQFAAWDAGMGGCRKLCFLSLLSIYFSILSVYGSSSMFCAANGIWVLTNLPFFLSQPGKDRPAKQDNSPDNDQAQS